MLHGVRLQDDGRAVYVARWVATKRLANEVHFGRTMSLRIGELRGVAGLIKILIATIRQLFGRIPDLLLDGGTANTALQFHDGRLLALVESSLPSEIRIESNGDLLTRGRNRTKDTSACAVKKRIAYPSLTWA